MRADTDAVGPDNNLTLTDTIAEANTTPTEIILGHATGTVDAITEVLPSTHTQMPHQDTPHQRSSSHRSSSAYSRDHSRSQS